MERNARTLRWSVIPRTTWLSFLMDLMGKVWSDIASSWLLRVGRLIAAEIVAGHFCG
jgi:hypothetical protein